MSVLLFLCFAYALNLARDFLPGAALMPVSAALVGTVLCAIQVAQELRGRSVPVADEDDVAGTEPVPQAVLTGRAARHLAALAGYGAMIWMAGIRLATGLWVLGFLLLVARMRWPAALLYAAAAVAGMEVLSGVLGLSLPKTGIVPLLR